MHHGDSFESQLISKASLFTSLTAAGQINRLERGESLYVRRKKNLEPVGKEFWKKVIKIFAFINTVNPPDAVVQQGVTLHAVISTAANS